MPTISDAVLEAYASAPADSYVLHTIELIHPAFVDESAQPDSIRIVLDTPDISLQLENDHPLWPAGTKLFTNLGMTFSEPSQEDGRFGEMQFALDNIPQLYRKWVDGLTAFRAKSELIYREWLCTRDEGTGAITPLGQPDRITTGLSARGLRVTLGRIEGVATFQDPLGETFPTTVFDKESSPGLFVG